MCVYDGRRPRIEPWGVLATLVRFSILRKGWGKISVLEKRTDQIDVNRLVAKRRRSRS